MDAHLSGLLSAIGPGLCYALGACALVGLRSLFRNFEHVLKRNAEAHDKMLARINEQELRLAGHSARLDENDRAWNDAHGRENATQQALMNISERLGRLEAGR